MIRPLQIENWLKEHNLNWTKSRKKEDFIDPDEYEDEDYEESQQEEADSSIEDTAVGGLTYKFQNFKSVIITVEYLKNKKRSYVFSNFYKDFKGNRCETGFSMETEEDFIEELNRRRIAEYIFGWGDDE